MDWIPFACLADAGGYPRCGAGSLVRPRHRRVGCGKTVAGAGGTRPAGHRGAAGPNRGCCPTARGPPLHGRGDRWDRAADPPPATFGCCVRHRRSGDRRHGGDRRRDSVDGVATPVTPPVVTRRRPGRLALTGGIAVSLALAALAAAWARPADAGPTHVDIPIRYSHYERTEVIVRAGSAVTFVLHNGDPIDHEWIVGDAAVHERHRTGTEPVHGDHARPRSRSRPGTTRTTTVTFAHAGDVSSTSATSRATRRTGWWERSSWRRRDRRQLSRSAALVSRRSYGSSRRRPNRPAGITNSRPSAKSASDDTADDVPPPPLEPIACAMASVGGTPRPRTRGRRRSKRRRSIPPSVVPDDGRGIGVRPGGDVGLGDHVRAGAGHRGSGRERRGLDGVH